MSNLIEKILAYFGYFKQSFTSVPTTVKKAVKTVAVKKATTRKPRKSI
jgi:hypothetical protein